MTTEDEIIKTLEGVLSGLRSLLGDLNYQLGRAKIDAAELLKSRDNYRAMYETNEGRLAVLNEQSQRDADEITRLTTALTMTSRRLREAEDLADQRLQEYNETRMELIRLQSERDARIEAES